MIRYTRPFSPHLSARRLNKISNCGKLNHRLWTNSALFTSLNVTSAMYRLFWFHTSPSTLTSWWTQKTLLHLIQLESIFGTNILWLQKILQRIFVFWWSARTSTSSTASSMKCFLFKSWDLLSMCNRAQFVLRFSISFY